MFDEQQQAEDRALTENTNQNRLGKFLVSRKFVVSEAFPAFLAKIEFVPVKVEVQWVENNLEYVGFSPCFDELIEGQSVPQYELQATNNEDGELESVEAVRAY